MLLLTELFAFWVAVAIKILFLRSSIATREQGAEGAATIVNP